MPEYTGRKMILDQINQRLEGLSLLPELHTQLIEVLSYYDHDPRSHALHRLPIDVYFALGGEDERVILPFAIAWSLLDIAVLRLDHLQDGDQEDHVLPTHPNIGASYSLILSLYVLADALLDELDAEVIPPQRLVQIRRLWNDCILVAASGQQRDLLSSSGVAKDVIHLDQYQELAHAKAGALFALAFGSAALHVTEDKATISACRFIGDVYGALLQLSDDLEDHPHQQGYRGLTLLTAYTDMQQNASTSLPDSSVVVQQYWQYVNKTYRVQVDKVLHHLDNPSLGNRVRQLFDAAFGLVE
jgi:geranylgeranyl pyrophosphate synthase